jgi:hypothetical protein
MKINNIIEDPLWDKIPCSCNHDSVITEYPIAKCIHCKCKAQQDSIPLEDFDYSYNDFETNEKITKRITEINLVHGDLDDVVGWRLVI